MTKMDMLITSPQPSLDKGRYYESEDYISHTDSKRSFLRKRTTVKNIAQQTATYQ
jgi:hypothetical protein